MGSRTARIVAAFVTGVLMVSAAWAGTVVVPATDAATADAATWDTPAATLLAGAAKQSIEPRPDDYGGTWLRDREACATLSESVLTELGADPSDGAHLAHTGSPWPENPDCLYMGGYGIGPMFPIVEWDQTYGLWVRAFAVQDATGDTLVLAVIDAEGYFWDYDRKCDDCGIEQITERLGAELDIDPAGIVVAATHSHTAPDLIGGWGFVPDWYMTQVTDTIESTIREAVAGMRPAVLEVGEERARPHNRERRDTYRSAEEQQVTWLRAVALGRNGKPDPGDVVATVGAFAAHPTTRDHENGVAHADWPGVFAATLEERFGGVGLHLMTGLGNMSAAGGTTMGQRLAALVPGVGTGVPLEDTDVRVARTTWQQPATNVPLTALAVPGFFDHQFDPVPASVRTGPEPDTAPCTSASPTSVRVPAAAARIGDGFALTTAPGEIFSNYSNTVKEKSGALVTMPLGQANDALGYMPQSFELNPVGQQGLGFFAGGYLIVNYEDSYAIDRCFGDQALETTLGLLDGLR